MSEENTAVDERRRIESMTLGEIKEAKARLADRIGEAIEREIDAFNQSYDWGAIGVDVETEVYRFDNDYRYKDKRNSVYRIKRNVTITSDLED